MKIVDAQVHIWAANTPERPWPARAEPHRAPLGKEELLAEMDKAGVDGVVIVPPSWEGDRNDVALDAAASHPDRFCIMGRFDPDAPGARARPDRRLEEAEGHAGHALHLPHRGPAPAAARRPLRLGVGRDGEGAAFPPWSCSTTNTCISPTRSPSAIPGLRLVLDHLGLKSGKDVSEATNFATLDKVLALAKRPNVAAKVSAMPCYADDKTYPFRSVHPHIRRVFDAFGPKRTFWGTDWSRLPCTYRQGVTMFTEEMPWLKGDDLEWVMGRGICDWIGWRK